jgi:uncharacterized protein
MHSLIGRAKESKIFQQIVASKKPEFVGVYGRRRIGKTFLIQQCLAQTDVYLECTGLKDGNTKTQLANFIQRFSAVFYPQLSLSTPRDWRSAFTLLTTEIKKIPATKKIVLFLDEIPWLATKKSTFLQNLDYFWNTEWNKLPNFKLITCGSAASWMLNNLINAKGGLHNRITQTILLTPFTLAETKKFLHAHSLKWTNQQILDIYMITGGVPFYLEQLKKNRSIAQNINELCFTENGLLYQEFPRLFKSLFDAHELNLRITQIIAQHRYGVSFNDLIKRLGKKAGGRFSERLAELEAAGFIQGFLPFGRKTRDRFYKVIDEYTMFYFAWIAHLAERKTLPRTNNHWLHLSKTSAWKSWAGYTFEGICYKHVDKIIKALGLDGTSCLVGTWRYLPKIGDKNRGAQIDLLLDRGDSAISLCEMKYTTAPFVLDKSYAKELMHKVDTFQEQYKTKKQIFLTMITTMGVKKNIWTEELIHDSIDLDALFIE